MSIGILYIFIKHTSASITINEGADPSVRVDFETHFNKLVPENSSDFIHNAEGPDDMPAHIKSALLGSSILIPIKNGRMNLGTWQGYLPLRTQKPCFKKKFGAYSQWRKNLK